MAEWCPVCCAELDRHNLCHIDAPEWPVCSETDRIIMEHRGTIREDAMCEMVDRVRSALLLRKAFSINVDNE